MSCFWEDFSLPLHSIISQNSPSLCNVTHHSLQYADDCSTIIVSHSEQHVCHLSKVCCHEDVFSQTNCASSHLCLPTSNLCQCSGLRMRTLPLSVETRMMIHTHTYSTPHKHHVCRTYMGMCQVPIILLSQHSQHGASLKA